MALLGPGARRAVLSALILAWGAPLPACRAAAARPATAPAAPLPDRGLLDEGDRARREGRSEDAITAYARAVDARPASIPAHLRLVAALLATGRRSEARARYEARVRAPSATEADRVMAARLATDGSAEAVRAVYVDAARGSPGEAWWRLALAEVDLAAADRWIDRLGEARGAGDRPAAAEALRTAEEALARAASAVENAATRAPALPEVRLYRGFVRSLEGDLKPTSSERVAAWTLAAESFEAAVAADPLLVDAWAGLADARQRAGDPDAALAARLAALRLAPNDADLRRGAGLTLHALERYGDAAEMYLDAARLDRLDATSFLNAGDCRAAAGDFEGALDAYAHALARDAEAVEAHVKRGAVLERLGRLAEARAEYATYLERGGEHAADARRRIERIVAAEGRR